MKNPTTTVIEKFEEIIDNWGRNFEPATSTRGQGGLPITGGVVSWEYMMSKDLWNHHKGKLVKELVSSHQDLLKECVRLGEGLKTDEHKVSVFGKRMDSWEARSYDDKKLVNAVISDYQEIISKLIKEK